MYNYERLSDKIEIATSSEHTFGTDAVLLADFAMPTHREKAIDLGTGCGIIPMLWARNENLLPITCIDIQKNACAQVENSIKRNSLEDRIKVYNADLRKINEIFGSDSFNLVTMNPPYKSVNSGIESQSESARIARHEVCCTVDDAVKCASYLLKFKGRLCMCHRPERLADVIFSMRKHSIEPKRLRFVCDRHGEAPFLFLIEGKKGSKPFLTVEKQLILKEENMRFTKEMTEIYADYAKNREV